MGGECILERRPGRLGGTGQLVPGQWRAQTLLQLLPERVLELGVAAQAEFCDESGDRRGTHSRALREAGEALEAGDRVEGEQHLPEPSLRGTQRSHSLADQLHRRGTRTLKRFLQFRPVWVYSINLLTFVQARCYCAGHNAGAAFGR